MRDKRKDFLATLGVYFPPNTERLDIKTAAYRYENKLNLWDGLPLTEKDLEEIWVDENE